MRSLPFPLPIPRLCVLHYTRDRSYDCRRLSSTFTSTPPSFSTTPSPSLPRPERLDDGAFRGGERVLCNRAGTWYFKKLRVIAKTLSSEDEEGIPNGGRHANGELWILRIGLASISFMATRCLGGDDDNEDEDEARYVPIRSFFDWNGDDMVSVSLVANCYCYYSLLEKNTSCSRSSLLGDDVLSRRAFGKFLQVEVPYRT